MNLNSLLHTVHVWIFTMVTLIPVFFRSFNPSYVCAPLLQSQLLCMFWSWGLGPWPIAVCACADAANCQVYSAKIFLWKNMLHHFSISFIKGMLAEGSPPPPHTHPFYEDPPILLTPPLIQVSPNSPSYPFFLLPRFFGWMSTDVHQCFCFSKITLAEATYLLIRLNKTMSFLWNKKNTDGNGVN